MLVGTAQLDITPEPGIELAEFAVRLQPATAVLDSLHALGTSFNWQSRLDTTC
ncbi:MAG: hypothetical protein KA191_00385 [Verrucomicrobia bacterium]|nr:hypothetical protein [Verrucomicrobiota bacterium]MDI9380637.1 hypothetical protein [Verrucomicrobiota bacterium]NMD20169.1 hypothetical protein [Verrucomicrobiota bacterium]HNV00330.1 hypothetical protein [Verrucomicrobiota bacterium]HOA59766.1 hypothetical protein [Verrucomicrobiota bacterium]